MKTILMIDDDKDLTEIVQYMIKKDTGFELLVAHDSLQGVFLAKEHKPDLLLLDIMLPGATGDEIMAQIKGLAGMKDVPVIFMTGLLSDKDAGTRGLSVTVGGKDYQAVAKPFERHVLINRIKESLGAQL